MPRAALRLPWAEFWLPLRGVRLPILALLVVCCTVGCGPPSRAGSCRWRHSGRWSCGATQIESPRSQTFRPPKTPGRYTSEERGRRPRFQVPPRPRQAILQQHCSKCHGPETAEAEAAARYSRRRFCASRRPADHWVEVLDRLNLGEMPPEDEPRPDAASWASHRLDHGSNCSRARRGQRIDGRARAAAAADAAGVCQHRARFAACGVRRGRRSARTSAARWLDRRIRPREQGPAARSFADGSLSGGRPAGGRPGDRLPPAARAAARCATSSSDTRTTAPSRISLRSARCRVDGRSWW